MAKTRRHTKLLAAHEIIKAGRAPSHVELWKAEGVSVEDLFRLVDWSLTKSLNASQLAVQDDFAVALAGCETIKNLWWLDLAGNSGIARDGVRAIAEGVQQGRLPKLEWMNLIGTEYDATPYIDGSYWRMTRNAESLTEEFGAQAWMMLGSRQPELSGREPLRPLERRLPPDRFKFG
ncbi:MAG: hypothetical protein WDO70_10525 [Alphaproteobacteria bacterium]